MHWGRATRTSIERLLFQFWRSFCRDVNTRRGKNNSENSMIQGALLFFYLFIKHNNSCLSGEHLKALCNTAVICIPPTIVIRPYESCVVVIISRVMDLETLKSTKHVILQFVLSWSKTQVNWHATTPQVEER